MINIVKTKSINIPTSEMFKSYLPKFYQESSKIALEHYEKSFDDEGFTDQSLEKWEPLKRPERGGVKILQQTGALKDSLNVTIDDKGFIITSPLPYAQIHNNGGISGRNGSSLIPKRQFVGESQELNNKISNLLSIMIKSIFNK